MSDPDLGPVFVAFSGWIRHIDSLLAESDAQHHAAEQALRTGDIKAFGTAFGTAHGQLINARKDIAAALARGMDLPSDS